MNINLKKNCPISKKELLKNLKDNALLFKMIDNPSEELIIDLLKINMTILQYVDDQTDQIAIAAVKTHHNAIQYVTNRNLTVCYEACKKFKETSKGYSDPRDVLISYWRFIRFINIVEFTDINDCIKKIENKIKLQQLMNL